MAEAEKAVSIRLSRIVIIQSDRVHHTQEISVIGDTDKRPDEQQINNEPTAGKDGEILRFNQSFHAFPLPLRKQLHIFVGQLH